jgi:hypothetical protein
MWLGLIKVEVEPSPKFQAYVTTPLELVIEELLNSVEKPAQEPLKLKSGVGFCTKLSVIVFVDVLWQLLLLIIWTEY